VHAAVELNQRVSGVAELHGFLTRECSLHRDLTFFSPTFDHRIEVRRQSCMCAAADQKIGDGGMPIVRTTDKLVPRHEADKDVLEFAFRVEVPGELINIVPKSWIESLRRSP